MTDADLLELHTWALAHESAGSVRGRQVLGLIAELERLKNLVGTLEFEVTHLRRLVAGLSDRVADQSELLSRRAEKREPEPAAA